MKKQLIILTLGMLVAFPGWSKTVTSRISSVTVYLNGAQVYRKAKTTLKKGTNEIIIDDVSPYMNEKVFRRVHQALL